MNHHHKSHAALRPLLPVAPLALALQMAPAAATPAAAAGAGQATELAPGEAPGTRIDDVASMRHPWRNGQFALTASNLSGREYSISCDNMACGGGHARGANLSASDRW